MYFAGGCYFWDVEVVGDTFSGEFEDVGATLSGEFEDVLFFRPVVFYRI